MSRGVEQFDATWTSISALACQQMSDVLRIQKEVTTSVYERKVQQLQQEVEGLRSENESLKSECSALKTNAKILELELQRCRSAMDAMQASTESSKRRDLNSVVSTAKQTRESLARVDNACKNLERRKELEDNYVQVVRRKDEEIADLREKLSRYKTEKQKVAQELDLVLKQRHFISEQLVLANAGDDCAGESK
ncbi:hypothetical protein GUITHDRAFT_134266 [Guillardia theta CCMP2712]|uniref:Uncharacterized protein n=2 Tax=Guillardia theta TaxID=55529 RepID=L1JU58_GUITC|nr:hypothetical protein GUITHDRAFT_134266 [Guillardia theta CCMP2712]EKX51952.1 hypothetical protein GUITHDRAFT_134266 [Guillardia theta CCMP2712]|eukprot:XP_005838932.1 hypothetical protein GUITHDRAFT_134266 [Guillardia theta CCMP2712]